MQRQNWVLEFEEDIEKLENRYNKFSFDGKKHLQRKKASNEQRNLKLEIISLEK